MKKIDEDELDKIYGGNSISGTVINALISLIELLRNAGYEIGSGIRRISENNMCSLE